LVVVVGLVLILEAVPVVKASDVNIAVLFPVTGHWPVGKRMASTVRMAVEDINNDANLLPNRTIKFLFNDTGCLARKGLGEVVNLWAHMRENLHAFIGPGCDTICESAGMLAAEWNVPMISWGCASSHLSNKDDYPTFARTLGPWTKVSNMLLRIMQYYSWKRLSIVASTEVVWQLTAHDIKVFLEEHGLNVKEFHSFDPGHEHISGREKANHLEILEDVKVKSRSKYRPNINTSLRLA
jgi:ABC-type branched-subunit amino acid transport system substrate-binding protein